MSIEMFSKWVKMICEIINVGIFFRHFYIKKFTWFMRKILDVKSVFNASTMPLGHFTFLRCQNMELNIIWIKKILPIITPILSATSGAVQDEN